MDSEEEFIYEVPLVPLETFKTELIEHDNDCTIVEDNSKTNIQQDTIKDNNNTLAEELNNAPSYQINDSDEDIVLIDNTNTEREDGTKTLDDTITPGDGINLLKHGSNPEDGTAQGDINKEIIKPSSPIVLKDSPDDCTIITTPNRKHPINSYEKLYEENKLLLEVIEKCLHMENSKGMLRIVNKTLLPIYFNADISFRISEKFSTALLQLTTKLDLMPERKFSHVKEICELLKLHKWVEKKKVPFVTLETNLNGKNTRKRRKHKLSTVKRKKAAETQIAPISCDSDTDIEIINDSPVQINLDSDDSVDNHLNNNDNQLNDSHSNNNHLNDNNSNDGDVVAVDDANDNLNKENDVMNLDSVTIEIPKLADHTNDGVVVIDDENDNSNKENNVLNGDSITKETVKSTVLQKKVPISEDTIKIKIESYEKEIETLQKIIENLETREVLHDTFSSPYIVCEDYKKRIVTLYEKICKLLGTESVKRHEVRLKVAKGHPEGPVRCLEEFVNSKIDEHGNPPFPDMSDVVECVSRANLLYNLNWSYSEVLIEARALFIHYGRAMQKRRMRREWRHLLKYAKEEAPDPAEEDPVLEAKLAENDRISKQREQELFDRYAEIEETNPRFALNMSEEDSDSAPTGSDIRSVVRPRDTIALNTYESSCNGSLNSNVTMFVSSPEKTNSVQNTSNIPNAPVNIELPISNSVNQQNMIILCNTPATSISQNLVTSVIQNLPILNIPGPIVQNLVTNIVQAVPNVVNIPKDALIVNPQKGANVNNFHKDVNFVNQVQNDFNLPNHIQKDGHVVKQVQNDLNHIKHIQKDVNLVNQPKEAFHIYQSNVIFENQSTGDTGSFAPIVSHKIKHENEGSTVDTFTHITKIIFENSSKESLEEESKSDLVEENESMSLNENKEKSVGLSEKEVCYKEMENDSQTDNVTSIKKECEDLPNLLEELGDVTATIFGIEDPFVVVEISDSSDSEDED